MTTIASDVRLAAALAAAASLTSPPAAADCTCRALGQDFELGRVVCLSTPNGPRLATCGMVLNNTSWRLSDTPCVSAHGNVERASEPTTTPAVTSKVTRNERHPAAKHNLPRSAE